MKDNNPPQPSFEAKLVIVAFGIPLPLRIGSKRVCVVHYAHGFIWWADGMPVAYLADAEVAEPERKNQIEFEAKCPPDVAAEIAAYASENFPQTIVTTKEHTFWVAVDGTRLIQRIVQGK